MKTSELYPSSYLKATDLQGRQLLVTIDKLLVEDLGDESKPVLYFRGKQKGLVLNRTNAGAIESLYGDDTDRWAGQSIVLYSTKVTYQGSLVPAIRIMPPLQPLQQPLQPPVQPPQPASPEELPPADGVVGPLTGPDATRVQQAREGLLRKTDDIPF